MTPSITFRPIGAAVLDDYRATRLRALGDAPTAFGSTLARELELTAERWRSRAAEFDGVRAAGFLASTPEFENCGLVGIYLEPTDPTLATLVSMWVAPEVRELGVGRALVEQALAWARDRGVRTVQLMVTSNNERAIRLYSKLGFALTGRQEPYPNDPALSEREMRLTLY